MYLQDLDNSTKTVWEKLVQDSQQIEPYKNGWFEGFIISKSGHKYVFLCPHLQENLGVEFNIKHKKPRKKCDHHSKHTKFIKKSNGKNRPTLQSSRDGQKASFWLPSLALGAPYFKR
uniref:Class D beta-lactamase n=1 Tax=Klebsiella pneumoniae TaxID=573 RepID=A0A8B0SUC9_KLEPN|nr:Class D beta-lactamase [Klebsiella pneumoniae]